MIPPHSDYGKAMWSDLKKMSNVQIVDDVNMKALFYPLFHVHFSFRINRYIDLPFKSIWKNIYPLSHIKFDSKESYTIIFTDVSLCNYNYVYLSEIKKKHNLRFVLMIVNSMNRMEHAITKELMVMDDIYTFDKNEAKRYHFKYYPAIYSKQEVSTTNLESEKAFFVGVSKGRLKKLVEIYDKLTDLGIECEFYISGVKKEEKIVRKNIVYNQWIQYNQVLKKIAQSKYLIEVMDQNNSGITLRTLEAVSYNKKLLTNNKKVSDFEFYNPKYIQIFSDIDKIDINFFKKEKVEYNYHNEYSPLNFIQYINKKENMRIKI